MNPYYSYGPFILKIQYLLKKKSSQSFPFCLFDTDMYTDNSVGFPLLNLYSNFPFSPPQFSKNIYKMNNPIIYTLKGPILPSFRRWMSFQKYSQTSDSFVAQKLWHNLFFQVSKEDFCLENLRTSSTHCQI